MSTGQEPPLDRFCDLVMKGGITSGVVYPGAISALARHYRFKSIGGTSAGAIAAVLTAAAEFNRRHGGAMAGFAQLEKLPHQLQDEVAPGQRRLMSLFQPQPGTRRLFSVLAASLNSKGTGHRIRRILLGALRAYWPATLGAAVSAVLALWCSASLYTALLTAAVVLVLLLGLCLFRDLTHHLVNNGFGLCTGMGDDARQPALTPWLHERIQQTAGLAAHDAPLTFGALENAPGYPGPPFEAPDDDKRSIHLQMFSTNLSHGRPYIFPLASASALAGAADAQDRLFFRAEELAGYLPANVLQHLSQHGNPYRRIAEQDPADAEGERLGLRELPPKEHFPVLLAARLSLSFPFLISAVPLWAIHRDRPRQARFRRCWFSDGGISSNFPMHLFDSLVPAWPTFGINLEDMAEDPRPVHLPPRYTDGYGERWHLFGKEDARTPDADDQLDLGGSGSARLGGFVTALVNTMQNWNDNALSRMPGVRDRIVRVRLQPDQGGMNLDMTPETLKKVAGLGEEAAKELIARFAQPGPDGGPAPGWDDQRWIRLGVLLRLMQERAAGVQTALREDLPHTRTFADLARRAATADSPAPPGYEAPLTPEQLLALTRAIDALKAFMDTCQDAANATRFQPIPKPELRLRPPL